MISLFHIRRLRFEIRKCIIREGVSGETVGFPEYNNLCG